MRGSTPTPERRNARYGGNTACIEVGLANGTLIVLDCGSGVRGLGKRLARAYGERPLVGYFFLTHFHWDHIQGIPFFNPLYKPGNTFLFHTVRRRDLGLQAVIEGQMGDPYFPVNMSAMGATRRFYDLDYAPINLNGAIITPGPLNHPQECAGYRIEADGATFVLATDTEPGSPLHDRSVRDLARGADVFVYDAQYTPEQLKGEKKGWGHSSWLEGVNICRECDVKQLILFHHDPDSDDSYLDGLVERARQEFSLVTGAAEGLEIDLPRLETARGRLKAGAERRRDRRYKVELPVRLGWRAPGGETREALGAARDISKSGMYFVAPSDLAKDSPVNVEMIFPGELTHRGDIAFHYVAHPLRQEALNRVPGLSAQIVGVAARLSLPENDPTAKVTVRSKEVVQ